VRTLATPQQEQSPYLDEVAAVLVAVPYPHIKPSRPGDTEYGPRVAIAEVEAWLEAGPNGAQSSLDRHSFAADVTYALSQLGPLVRARTPSAADLTQAVQASASCSLPDRGSVRSSLAALQDELREPDTAVAAFDDLLDAVRDLANSHLLVTARLTVLTEVLEISDRASAEICRILGGVLDDQALEISIAHHNLDGTPISNAARPDEFAGLAEDDRLELSHRYLLRPAQEDHHVVWFAYDDARVAVQEVWRLPVGMVEFFDGPTLLEKLNNPDATTGDQSLPAELLTPIGPAGRDIDLWPSPDHQHWVAARVDLGTSAYSNPIQVGRDQADAVVAVAALKAGKSTWTPLAGVLHVVGGIHRGSEQFHTPDEIQHRVRVDNDRTAAEFPEIADAMVNHLPIVDPALQRLLREISALNASTMSDGFDLFPREVAVVETVTRLNQQSPSNWPEFLKLNLPAWQARAQIIDEIYGAVWQVLNDFYYEDLTLEAIVESRPDGLSLFKQQAALDLVPHLAPGLSNHHMTARRLREVARRIQDLTHLEDWAQELASDCRRKINRAARLRNGLSHAGAAPAQVMATVRLRFNRYARTVAHTALESVVAGRPVKQAFDDYRTGNKRWRQGIPTATDVCDALFGPPPTAATSPTEDFDGQ